MALHEILTNSMTAPREARQAMARFLSKAKLSQLTDDAQLLASELVTNAVRHSSGPIDVRAYVRDGFLRLEVGDSAVDRAPLPRTAVPDDEGGRGMELVEKLSARWGWRARGPVKVVWLDLPMPGREPAPVEVEDSQTGAHRSGAAPSDTEGTDSASRRPDGE